MEKILELPVEITKNMVSAHLKTYWNQVRIFNHKYIFKEQRCDESIIKVDRVYLQI